MAVCGGSGSSEGEELLGEGPLCPPSTGLALPAEPGDVALVPEVLSDVLGGEWLLLGPGLASPDVLSKIFVGEWWFSSWFCDVEGGGGSETSGVELSVP